NDTKRAGTIGLAAAIALQYFGVSKVMLCDVSDFRLEIAEKLGFAICNTEKESFAEKTGKYFETAPSLKGPTANIHRWIFCT
ncbi:MAG: theronine dehydrogenase, partial [Clostridium sp.]|nr:theronine dehydrogenase [Clostridium sp.]